MNTKLLPLVLCASCLLVSARAESDTPMLQGQSPIRVSAESKSFDLLVMDPTRHRLLAAHSQAGTLSIVDTAANKLEVEIPVGKKPSGVAVDPQDGKYFVGTLTGVTFVDSKTLRKTAVIATPGPTDAMVYADGKLYVGHDDGSELWVIDVKSAKLVGHIDLPGVPELADTDGRHLYQNIKDKDEVVAIDLSSGKIVATWPTPATDSPHGLALDSKNKRLYISGHNADVTVLSLPEGKKLPTIDIGDGRSDQTALDLSSDRLYVPNTGKLVAVQLSDDKVLGSVDIPQSCHSVAVDPVTHLVWIAYVDDSNSYVQAFKP